MLKDQTVGVIDNGADVCFLDNTSKITKVLISSPGLIPYVPTNFATASKLVQDVSTVLEFFGVLCVFL